MNAKIKLFILILGLVCIMAVIAIPKGIMAANRGTWAVNVAYNIGDTVTYTYNGNTYTYTCIQTHTSIAGWDPPYVPALWTQGAASSGSTAIPTNTPTKTPTGIPNPTNTPVGSSSLGYGGAAAPVPGVVEAERYDTGGNTVSYGNTGSTVNQGGQFRSDGVGIETTTDTNGGYNVGWTATGEWLKYTVNVTAGTYNIDFRVASTGSAGQLDLKIDGTNVTGTVNVPNTGGWQTWTSVTKSGIAFSGGSHVLTLDVVASGFNINWFKVYSTGSAPTVTKTFTPTATLTHVCNYPGWAPGTDYPLGTIVKYTANGNYYQEINAGTNGSDATDPTVSTWYWGLYTCTSGGGTPTITPTSTVGTGSGFIVTALQFNQWFPNRNALYTYANFITAKDSYPGFADSGNNTNDAIEAAAFFAHVAHESASLVYVDEQSYPVGYYQSCGTYTCVNGQDYHGRGPLQISWNYNYSMASDGMYFASPGGWVSRMTPSVGADILHNASLVSTDGVITWKTAIWYWMNHGKDWDPIKNTPHQHIASGGSGFGATIDDINGGLECSINNYPNGSSSPNTAEMQDRVNFYNTYLSNLGVSDSRTKTC